MGLNGEGKIDDSIWVIKTHYPERVGHGQVAINKCIVIIRNPLDAIFSLFNMVGTTSHNESLSEQVIVQATQQSDIFTKFVR